MTAADRASLAAMLERIAVELESAPDRAEQAGAGEGWAYRAGYLESIAREKAHAIRAAIKRLGKRAA